MAAPYQTPPLTQAVRHGRTLQGAAPRRLRASRTAADWENAGFGVYVHWPFCLAKCPYCDFNSHVSRTVDQDAWRAALVAEVERHRDLISPRRADTVFFGGGTPSLMPPETVAAVIEAVDRVWGLADDAEITLEANPTSVEAAKFRAYAAAGVNRVSMGVQALNDADLKALGRMHSAAEARATFDIARQSFERVSFDLIYARVGQSTAAWERELADALALAVDHLSLYQLTIEQGTRFAELHAAGKLVVPGDDLAVEMYEVTQAMTAAAGVRAYEVSNHARPGAESRHNLIYWRYGDYAGIGPGAHGRLTQPDGTRVATEAARAPQAWLDAVAAGTGTAQSEVIPGAAQAEEYAMMGLRLAEGIDLARLRRLDPAAVSDARIADLVASGHLERSGDRLRATARGRLLLNRVLAEMLVSP